MFLKNFTELDPQLGEYIRWVRSSNPSIKQHLNTHQFTMQSFAATAFFALVAAVSANVHLGLGHIGYSTYAIAKPAAYESAQILTPGNSVVSGSLSGPVAHGGFYSGLIHKPVGVYGAGLGYFGGVATKL